MEWNAQNDKGGESGSHDVSSPQQQQGEQRSETMSVERFVRALDEYVRRVMHLQAEQVFMHVIGQCTPFLEGKKKGSAVSPDLLQHAKMFADRLLNTIVVGDEKLRGS